MYALNKKPKKPITLTKFELTLIILVTAVVTLTIKELWDLRAI